MSLFLVSLLIFALKQLPFILNLTPSCFFIISELSCNLASETERTLLLIQIHYRTTSHLGHLVDILSNHLCVKENLFFSYLCVSFDYILLLSLCLYRNYVQPPLKTLSPLFLPSPLLNLQTVQAILFRQSSLSIDFS